MSRAFLAALDRDDLVAAARERDIVVHGNTSSAKLVDAILRSEGVE